MRSQHHDLAPTNGSRGNCLPVLAFSQIPKAAAAFFLLVAGQAVLAAQTVVSASGPGAVVQLIHTDRAVLDAQQPRDDLPCTVTALKPVLGFDFRFHSGYEASVPLVALAGPGNRLVILFRVTADEAEPVYFTQRIAVPQIEEDARGDAHFRGVFDLGEGRYHLDFLMRDRGERVCASFWDVTASLPPRDRPSALAMPAGTVAASEIDLFHIDPPVQRAASCAGLRLKILVNWIPVYSRSFAVQEADTEALLSAVRAVTRQSAVISVSLTVFSTQDMRVVYRQPQTSQLDFPAIGAAIRSFRSGTVEITAIANKHQEIAFLTDLISEELRGDDDLDGIVFVSSRSRQDESIDEAALRQAGPSRFPVFYLAYRLYQETKFWNDAIGHAVRLFKGREYGLGQPRDLGTAVADIISRALDAKKTRTGKTGAIEQQHPH
jgi:hypothetical protein